MLKAVTGVLVIVLLLGSPVLAESWQELYDQALEDLKSAHWEQAITKLREAVRQQPQSGRTITGKQGEPIGYFPYYLLGKAYFHLGKYSQAAAFFEREAGRAGLPDRVAREIAVYRQQIRELLGRGAPEFNRALKEAEEARLRNAFGEAAAKLERARELDAGEFQRRGLESLLANLRRAEKEQVEENRFRRLLTQAEEKEERGALQDALLLLQEADRVIAGRVEVDHIRQRIKERRENYARLKQAAMADEAEGRLALAVDKLQQAAEADPERFFAEGLSKKLTEVAAAITRQAQIEQLLVSAARAFSEKDYLRAIADYEKVLAKDPTHRVAGEQKRRAESLQLLEQAEGLIEDNAFEDALAAFNLSYDLDPENGALIYEKMRPHLQALSRQPIEVRDEWLQLMNDADTERFSREDPRVPQPPRPSRPRQSPAAAVTKPKPNNSQNEKAQQEAVFAAIQGPPEQAVRLLEKLRAAGGKSSAELEGWTGVAYARLSLLTSDPEQREKLQAKASQHFKLALRMDPDLELNPRLVAPHIQKLFSEVRQKE
ncbi:MAG TPA: hypothetical protein PLP42_03195 [Acidobacteriota bacterium]|nr:hypothetical protein [Acidobacteriota bacterium]